MNRERSEHPRPHFQRDEWINLNGEWSYEIRHDRPRLSEILDADHIDFGGSGERILVPFAPESPLSGVGYDDAIARMHYHRSVRIPNTWAGRDILLHFGAVYYAAQVYIDGRRVGHHTGGSTPFTIDISDAVEAGRSHDLVVVVANNLWDGTQPSGKQGWKHASYGCFYTATTGIWQTVWMEARPRCGLDSVHILPNADEGSLTLVPLFGAIVPGMKWSVRVLNEDRELVTREATAADGLPMTVVIPHAELWAPGNPVLYDLELSVKDGAGETVDRVRSYAGLRKIHVEGNKVFLNNRPLYQRLVLDQGFYPDGIWTAPSDEALKRDIELSMAAGFNGARLHQKAFEERFYYWADRLGYLCWAESPSWGLDYNMDGMPHRNFLSEWRELVRRDRNHPAVVTWTPFNETRQFERPLSHARVHTDAYAICKSLDPTRPVNDASGYIHHVTDLWTVHTYEQDPAKLTEQLAERTPGGVFRNYPEQEPEYGGQPYLVDEFGGIKWDPRTQADRSASDGQNLQSWGYGRAPQSLEEFYERLEGLVKAVADQPHIAGWCYTQLTDVEQERNGIYFYDRTEKFDMERIRSIMRTTPLGYDE